MDVSNALVAVSALSARAISPDVARACLILYARAASGELSDFNRHAVAVMLEDERLGASDDDVWECLVAAGLFAPEGLVLRPRAGIALAELFEEYAERDQVIVTLAEIAEVIAPKKELPSVAVSALDACAVLRRAQSWASDRLSYVSAHSLAGFPVFWNCADGEHLPFGSDYGSMTISETLLLILEQWRYDVARDCDRTLALANSELIKGWRTLLGLEQLGGWADGAMFLPYFDDDFVGAYVPARSTEGSCPTTDATAQRLFTLTQFAAIGRDEASVAEITAATRKAMDRSVRALVRWQSPVGAWGIFRYAEPDVRQPPIRDVSTRYAAEALVAACRSGLLGAEAEGRATEALTKLAHFLVSTAETQDGETSWAGDFDRQIAGDEERLRATVLTAVYLGGLSESLGDAQLAALQERSVAFAVARWRPDQNALLHVDFRVPSWHGLATDTFSWDMPTDALILTAAVELAGRGGSLPPSVETLLALASAQVLLGETHGHWLDLLMAERGKRRAFAQNSLHSVRAIRAFVAHQVAVASGAPMTGLLGS
jgi:hypothetical protein